MHAARSRHACLAHPSPGAPPGTPGRSELTSLVPAHSEATLDEVATAAWCQFFQCALYLEVRRPLAQLWPGTAVLPSIYLLFQCCLRGSVGGRQGWGVWIGERGGSPGSKPAKSMLRRARL
jgi:hypothetical protein